MIIQKIIKNTLDFKELLLKIAEKLLKIVVIVNETK